MARAIIWFIDDDDAGRHKRACLDWCNRHGVDIVALMRVHPDDAAERWQEVRRLAWDDGFDHLVVAREEQIPNQRHPSIIVVANEPPSRSRRRPDRRPKLIE